MTKLLTSLLALMCLVPLAGQTPIDTSKIGPQVGAAAPPFSGPDQYGVTRSLQSAAGKKGTMLVFSGWSRM